MTNAEQIRLVLGAQAQDRESLEALLHELQGPLVSYIAGIVGSTSANDVLQESLIQIWRDLKWLREPQLIGAWSYRIASRCSFKWLKRNRRFVQANDNTFLSEEIASPERGDLQLFVRADEFLEVVSPASRAVLVLHYLHEHTLQEVAAILEISPGTARSRLSYGLLRLREFMNRNGVKK